MNELNAKPKKTMGCGGCLLYLLGGTLVTLALLAGGGYGILMHTAYPLRKIAEIIEQASQPEAKISIKDITGSFASGARIKSVKWEYGEVENLCISYDNLLTALRSKRFIFREISVTKAHISLFEPESASTTAPSVERESPGTPLDWELFQIDKLSLTDILLTNRLTGFTLAIPKFEWTGFKWEEGKTEFGTMKADTPHFKLETGKATTPGFVTRLTGTIRPNLHPSILKAFNFDAEIGPLGSNTPCRVTAFDGALDATINPDGTGRLILQSLKVSSYFKGLWLQDLDLELETQRIGDDVPLQIIRGSFNLGQTRFTITPTTIETKGETQGLFALLKAVAEIDGIKVQYALFVKAASEDFEHHLTSQSALKPDELTALVLYGKSPADLTADEQAATGELKALLTFQAFPDDR